MVRRPVIYCTTLHVIKFENHEFLLNKLKGFLLAPAMYLVFGCFHATVIYIVGPRVKRTGTHGTGNIFIFFFTIWIIDLLLCVLGESKYHITFLKPDPDDGSKEVENSNMDNRDPTFPHVTYPSLFRYYLPSWLATPKLIPEDQIPLPHFVIDLLWGVGLQ